MLVVSDRRLLMCVTPAEKLFSLPPETRDRLELLWAAPRAEVTGAAVRRHRVRRRLQVWFSDDSWAAFVTPLGGSLDPARRLAAALTAQDGIEPRPVRRNSSG